MPTQGPKREYPREEMAVALRSRCDTFRSDRRTLDHQRGEATIRKLHWAPNRIGTYKNV